MDELGPPSTARLLGFCTSRRVAEQEYCTCLYGDVHRKSAWPRVWGIPLKTGRGSQHRHTRCPRVSMLTMASSELKDVSLNAWDTIWEEGKHGWHKTSVNP